MISSRMESGRPYRSVSKIAFPTKARPDGGQTMTLRTILIAGWGMGLAGIVAYGWSGDSGPATDPATASTGFGTTNTATSTTTSTSSVTTGTGGSASCSPSDVTGFMANWVPPQALHQGVCTDTQTSDFFAQCLMQGGDCQTWTTNN